MRSPKAVLARSFNGATSLDKNTLSAQLRDAQQLPQVSLVPSSRGPDLEGTSLTWMRVGQGEPQFNSRRLADESAAKCFEGVTSSTVHHYRQVLPG